MESEDKITLPPPHGFVSISEEAWRSGKSRYLCELCDRDFSDPIHTTIRELVNEFLRDVYNGTAHPHRKQVLEEFIQWTESRNEDRDEEWCQGSQS